MKVISLNIPVQYDKSLQRLVELGTIPNKSEGIRLAIHDFIRDECVLHGLPCPDCHAEQCKRRDNVIPH